jgi:hypothetical protein
VVSEQVSEALQADDWMAGALRTTPMTLWMPPMVQRCILTPG